MKCRKCKAEIPDGSKFCNRCGVKQELSKGAKTRGNGQGTAIKRGKTWTAVWTVSTYMDAEGKLHMKRKWKGGFPTKTAALAYAAAPAPEAPQSPTIRDYYTAWLRSDYLDLGKSKQVAYDIAWKRLYDVCDAPVSELTIERLQACVDNETDTYYPARDMRTLLSHLYKRAVAEGHARTNLAEFIRIPPLNEKEAQAFTEDEIKAMWAAYRAGNGFLRYPLIMIYSGMMPGELLQLKSDMVDFEAKEIRGAGLKTAVRKKKPIVFPDILTSVLQEAVSVSRSKQDYVVGMNKWTFYEKYHEALTSAGVRDLQPYSCRHTTATALAMGNIAPSTIQEVMRHAKFSTTERYIHPDNASSHAAVDSMIGE